MSQPRRAISSRNSFLRCGFNFSMGRSPCRRARKVARCKTARLHERNESARFDHPQQELRWRRALDGVAGGEVLERRCPDVDTYLIAIVDQSMHAGRFQQWQGNLQTIAIERAGELLRNNRADVRGRERFRGQRASRRATEVPARDEDVARTDLRWKFRIYGFEYESRHFLRRLEHDVRRRQRVGGNVVAELPATPLKNPARRQVPLPIRMTRRCLRRAALSRPA